MRIYSTIVVGHSFRIEKMGVDDGLRKDQDMA